MDAQGTASLERRRSALPPRRPEPRTAGTAGSRAPGAQDPSVFLTWATFDADATVLVEVAAEGPVLAWVNRACARLLGYAEQELVGQPLARLQRSPFAEREDAPGAPVLDPVRTTRRSTVVQRRDGSTSRVQLSAAPVGSAVAPSWVLRMVPEVDVAAMESALRASHERFEALAGQAPIAIFSSDRGLRLDYVNDRFCALFGRSAERLLGTDWLGHLHADDLAGTVAALQGVLQGTPAEVPVRLPQPDGAERSVRVRVVPVRDGRDAGFVGTVEDVTERLAWERRLAHQANHDPLTGLPNRRALLAAAAAALADGVPVALGLLDLDDFKHVNDTHGHECGDRLLREVGRRLTHAVRDTDLVARLGGDEFAVLCFGLQDEADARAFAGRLLTTLDVPLRLAGAERGVGGSLGVVLSSPGATCDDLLREADVAMYQVKTAGKRGWALFDDAARERLTRRLGLVEDLRRTLESGADLTLAYQPVVEVGGPGAGSRTVGVEALARWEHPDLGPVPPQEFVELAEQHGLVVPLGRLVQRSACAQLVRWDDELGPLAPRSVSVNVSPLELRAPGFVERLARVLEETGLPGHRLCVELTEGAVTQDVAGAAALLADLRRLGVRVALDDFGTGYSSLALLRELPVDALKIDRSFLADMAASGSDVVVSAVVGLAQALGLVAVAEGVETLEQLAELERLGCPLAQGFLFSQPLTPDALAAHVREGS